MPLKRRQFKFKTDFRKLVSEKHPDLKPQINELFEILNIRFGETHGRHTIESNKKLTELERKIAERITKSKDPHNEIKKIADKLQEIINSQK